MANDPIHVHGLAAMGVANIKAKDLPAGEVFLRRSLVLEPKIRERGKRRCQEPNTPIAARNGS